MTAAGESAPDQARVLRRLFLLLFLRGRSARGQVRGGAPTTIAGKLRLVLGIYALVGLIALPLGRAPLFVLALTMHAITFVFIGMFVAASGGEVLFNRDEADILLHRPVSPRALLWAKIRVLVEVALWMAVALNLVALVVGTASARGGWVFPLVHPLSLGLEALLSVAAVVLVYQLCLRWFGRERLDGLMTTAQAAMAVMAMLGGQLAPRLIGRFDGPTLDLHAWWAWLLPPVWFASLDDLATGHLVPAAAIGAALAVLVTAAVVALAFGRLAGDYGRGLQAMNEAVAPSPASLVRRRWIDRLVAAPPLRWWLRDPVSRASFLLCVAYLLRDRDVKLRVYPGLAPVVALPVILLVQGGSHHGDGAFGVVMAGGYFGFIPMLGQEQLRFSAQWQAADIFRCAPLAGPAAICHGVRRAVLLVVTMPCVIGCVALAAFAAERPADLALLLPGIIGLPVYALVPGRGGRSLPLAVPNDSARSARGGLVITAVGVVALVISALGLWARATGWFWWLIAVEAAAAVVLVVVLRRSIDRVRWTSPE